MSVLKNRVNDLAHLVETNERYIMDGQCYDKSNMKFEFMNFQPVTQKSPFYTPSLIRRCTTIKDKYTNYDWHDKATIGDMFIVDKNDPTITYALIDSAIEVGNAGAYESHTSIAKIQTENEVTNIIWQKGFNSSATSRAVNASYSFKEILGQNDKYLYVSVIRSFFQDYHNRHQTNEHIIVRYEKLTGVTSTVFDYETDYDGGNVANFGTSMAKIYETDTKIYFLFYTSPSNNAALKSCSPGENSIFYIDKTANIIKLVGKIAKDTVSPSGGTLYNSKGILKDEYLYFYQLTNITEPQMMLIKVNTVTDEFEKEIIAITFNSKVTNLPSITKDSDIERTLSVRLIMKEYEGKKYLHLIGYSTFNKFANNVFPEIVTLLINEDDFTLTAQSKYNPFNGTIKGYVECPDENLFLVSNRLSIRVLKFNTMTRAFEEMQIIDTPHFSFGCDTQNNIWIGDTSYVMHKHTIDLPTKININFKENAYDYKGTPIDTELHIDAINYLGQRIVANIELSVKGPITFADDEKTLTVATIKEGVLKVPVKVIGAGSISVYPRVMI